MFFRIGSIKKSKTILFLQAVPCNLAKRLLNSKNSDRYGRTSRCLPSRIEGSLTIEAALGFPLFLFAVTALLYVLLLFRLQAEVGRALTDIGKELGQYAYLSVSEDRETGVEILSAAYARQKLAGRLSEEPAAAVIKGGPMGISFQSSEIMGWDSRLVLSVSYQAGLPPGLTWFRPAEVTQSRVLRGWTGFLGRRSIEGEGEEELVYVTDYGTVFHRSLTCRHLKLSIRQMTLEEAKNQRNTEGGKYYSCERCWGKGGAFVYLTDSGNRYHEKLNCAGLTRGIRTVFLSQAGSLLPCSVCGG